MYLQPSVLHPWCGHAPPGPAALPGRWTRDGEDRVHVSSADGQRVGWLDLPGQFADAFQEAGHETCRLVLDPGGECPQHVVADAGAFVVAAFRRVTRHEADGCGRDGVAAAPPGTAWGDSAALARGRGRLISSATLPPDHVDTRLDLGYVVSVLLAQAA